MSIFTAAAKAAMTVAPKLLTSPCTIRMPKFITDCCTQVSEERRKISPQNAPVKAQLSAFRKQTLGSFAST